MSMQNRVWRLRHFFQAGEPAIASHLWPDIVPRQYLKLNSNGGTAATSAAAAAVAARTRYSVPRA